jgi:UDP-N-acetylglucosamine--N-acetylmuramyl-(pentapeptide) pyrophosphoryl-undecaprenol N-acetylglucosamine transferase
MRRIALAVGDTAGHVAPAIAVAEAYRRRFDVDVLFLVPSERPAAMQLVRRSGYALQVVSGSPLARVRALARVAAIGRAMAGTRRARSLLGTRGIELVIGFGGYATGGVLVAARSLGIPTAIVEPNVEPGLANRWLGHVVGRVYVSWPATRESFREERTMVIGTPVRTGMVSGARNGRAPSPRERPLRILVSSASRGGAFLAERVPAMLGAVRASGASIEAWHQTADVDPQAVGDAYRRAGVPARVDRFLDEMTEAYAWADFVIARAGASTLAELASGGLPSLLVPLADAAGDHQAANARAFAEAGAAWWIREADWETSAVAAQLAKLLADERQRSALGGAARRLAAPDAADRIVTDCEARLRNGR